MYAVINNVTIRSDLPALLKSFKTSTYPWYEQVGARDEADVETTVNPSYLYGIQDDVETRVSVFYDVIPSADPTLSWVDPGASALDAEDGELPVSALIGKAQSTAYLDSLVDDTHLFQVDVQSAPTLFDKQVLLLAQMGVTNDTPFGENTDHQTLITLLDEHGLIPTQPNGFDEITGYPQGQFKITMNSNGFDISRYDTLTQQYVLHLGDTSVKTSSNVIVPEISLYESGAYTVTYSAVDSHGMTDQKTRSVTA